MKRERNSSMIRALFILVMVAFTARRVSQNLKFGVHADPLITWMSSNSQDYNGEGLKAGPG